MTTLGIGFVVGVLAAAWASQDGPAPAFVFYVCGGLLALLGVLALWELAA